MKIVLNIQLKLPVGASLPHPETLFDAISRREETKTTTKHLTMPNFKIVAIVVVVAVVVLVAVIVVVAAILVVALSSLSLPERRSTCRCRRRLPSLCRRHRHPRRLRRRRRCRRHHRRGHHFKNRGARYDIEIFHRDMLIAGLPTNFTLVMISMSGMACYTQCACRLT